MVIGSPIDFHLEVDGKSSEIVSELMPKLRLELQRLYVLSLDL